MKELTIYDGLSVLVTGGAGFIGAHLVHKLVQLGCNVAVFDNFSTGRWDNLSDVKDTVNVIKGDVRNYESVKAVIKDQDVVFHLAASASVPQSIENPLHDFTCNALGTVNLLNAVRRVDPDVKVIFGSSAAVYGESSGPIPEDNPLNPCSMYGLSKLVDEFYCKMFHKIYYIPITILRYFNVYGPLQRRYVMYDILMKLRENPKELKVLGSGEQIRDFIYISDCVDATVSLATKEKAVGEVFNIGTGKGVKIRELVDLIINLLNLEENIEISYTGKPWIGDLQTLVADNRKLRDFGWQPRVDLRSGLTCLINSLQVCPRGRALLLKDIFIVATRDARA